MTARPRVRILVWHGAADDRDALEETYHKVSAELAGTPGLVGNELWRSATDPATYAIMSEWRDIESFNAWADDPGQHLATAPLRRFRTAADRAAEVYEVAAAH
ncbi:antibiotic biosynthesis monooxygenase [Sphaerisporangium sp. TRM90804]|uniref:antibiotic biosynthesis monooxygenase family protein n=1 Tax=Sphaerisporangium sp. TRM90804 TaxID=3031113 RepID=UPI00244D190E|nr:antibiotic biosynthesis monooxygenase [Sphaerisporangium sp. TRM90804]MDH2427187.1 antibiotic biosynthesis monooxygenase [Sphaerisporangium sp. TRM90804]